MGRFDFNTFAMASLTVIFVVFSLSLVSDGLYHDELETFGYPVEVADAPAASTGDEGPAYEPVLPLLASADPAAGEGIFRKCASCHSTGEENKVGPGLGGIINRAVAGHPGFGYSGALEAYAAEAPEWTYAELNGFLWKPKTYVPGTSMGFAGLSDVQERADVIAYLRTISGDPPLPTEEEIGAATATEGEEVAEGEAATDEGTPIEETVETGGQAVEEPVQNMSQEADTDGAQPAADGEAQTDGADAQPAAGADAVQEEASDLPDGADAPAAVGDSGVPGDGPTDAPVDAPDAADGSSTTPSVGGQGVPGNAIVDQPDPEALPDAAPITDGETPAVVVPDAVIVDPDPVAPQALPETVAPEAMSPETTVPEIVAPDAEAPADDLRIVPVQPVD